MIFVNCVNRLVYLCEFHSPLAALGVILRWWVDLHGSDPCKIDLGMYVDCKMMIFVPQKKCVNDEYSLTGNVTWCLERDVN